MRLKYADSINADKKEETYMLRIVCMAV
jgi:hypothetical protein